VSELNVPFNLVLKQMAEHSRRTQTAVGRGSRVLLGPLDTEIATTPYRIEYTEDRVKLKHYDPIVAERLSTPLLVTYALINRETMLDLQPGKSVVQKFLQEGIDLYMIDWGYPSRKDRYLTIDDHVNGYIDNIVDYICRKHRVSKINLMGICMGGTFAVMYAALHPQKIKNLITTVAPTHFNTDQGLLHIWMKALDVDRMVDTFGNIPGDLMNLGFLLLNPARLMIDKYVGFLDHVSDRGFVENFLRMEKWIFDSPDCPGETFRQFMKDCYQENLLIQSRMKIGGHRINLRKITMPLLNIYARQDHLVPPGACDLLTRRVASGDTQDVCIDTGHIGIYVSSKSQDQFAPRIVTWLKERDRPDPFVREGKALVRKRQKSEGVRAPVRKGVPRETNRSNRFTPRLAAQKSHSRHSLSPSREK
jgi:polyhydroxyalkanoate synthase subunit PhaC